MPLGATLTLRDLCPLMSIRRKPAFGCRLNELAAPQGHLPVTAMGQRHETRGFSPFWSGSLGGEGERKLAVRSF